MDVLTLLAKTGEIDKWIFTFSFEITEFSAKQDRDLQRSTAKSVT